MQRLYRVGLLVVSLVVPAAFGVEAERAIPHPARTQMAAGGERQASLQLSRDLIVVAVLAALQHAAGREKPAARPPAALPQQPVEQGPAQAEPTRAATRHPRRAAATARPVRTALR